ncbi:DUF1015 domain-containing protein [Enterococcus sp.]|uniref:DUF1015 domain-containing protein n=1 Tax=Enterococcus sp. TaxID=35783 RepID=UPI002FC7F1EC
MVLVKAFKGIRPKSELAAKIAELPYDVVNSQEAKELAQNNPYSYFHIDKAEIDLPETLSQYDEKVYQKAGDNLADFLEKGWLVKDNHPNFYLYQLTMDGRSQTGIVACTSIDDYMEGKIKKHEFTRYEKEIDRINHMKACDANTSPIFLTYKNQAAIQEIVENWKRTNATLYDFTSYHDVSHQVWLIDDEKITEQLSTLFEGVDALYIADGHHRSESAVKVGVEKRENKTNSPESDYFLSILFPAEELAILEYNRVLNVPVPENFLDMLSEHFEIEKTTENTSQNPREIQMYLDDQWYTLTIPADKIAADIVESLDVSYLQKHVFEKIFDIMDIRSDNRIDFVGGIRGSKELEKMVATPDWNLAFAMYPTQMSDLLAVADAGQIMPPKSTWFEPKLLSGLFLHDLETK